MQICGKTLYAVAPAQTLRCALLWRGVVPVARPSGPGQCPSLAFPPRSPRVAASRRVGSPWKRQTWKPVVAGAWVFSNRLVPLTHAWHARSCHTENSVSRLPLFVSLLCPFGTKHHSRFQHNLHPRRLAYCLHLTRRSYNWPLTMTNYVTGWQIWGSIKNSGKL